MGLDSYLTTSEVGAGARLVGGSNATVFTTDNTYEDIAGGTASALPTASTTDLTGTVNLINSALAVNAYVGDGITDTVNEGSRLMAGERSEPVAVTVSGSTKLPNTLVLGMTKGERGAGLSTTFAVPTGTTLSAVNISDPTSGDSYSLKKRELSKVNAQLAFAPTTNGFSTIVITGADYDGSSGLGGRKKTISITQGAVAYTRAE